MPQSITISGLVITGQRLTISGIVATPQRLTISGAVRPSLALSGFVTLPITLTPSTIVFSHPSSPVQSISITQGTLSGPYTAVSSDTGIATVTISGTTAFVTGVAEGSATITVSDTHGASATASVTVGAAAGGITLSAGALVLSTGVLAETTTSDPQTFTASRLGDTGPFTTSVTPAGIVAITGSGDAPGPITFTVTPVSVGMATITVSASDGTTSSLSVTVTGTLTAAVTSPKHAQSLVIAVSETNYAGSITPSFIGATSAQITPSIGFGPRTSFTITDATPGELFLIEFADTLGNTTILSLQSRNVSLGPVAYTFYDETGINPVAPGSQYQIYYQGDPQTAENLVTSGFLGVGGTATLSLDELTTYAIVWTGQQAPSVQTTFTTGATGISAESVTVTGYRSPNLSTLGYASQQTSQWTRGWVGSEYLQPGAPGETGIAYSLAYSFAALLGEGGTVNGVAIPGLDTFLQQINVATRLFNCIGPEIDSWFQDFLSPNFKRQIGESDTAFLARGLIAINGKVATRDALIEATNAAWTTLGNSGKITCDDSMSYPALLASLSKAAPYFVVGIPDQTVVDGAWLLGSRYLGVDTYLLNLTSVTLLDPATLPPLLVQAVESKRGLGTIPLYATILA